MSGGRVRKGDLACANAHAKSLFADLYPELALIGSGGVDAVVGLTDFHLDEIDVRKTIIANSCAQLYLGRLVEAGSGRAAPSLRLRLRQRADHGAQ